MLVLSFLFLSMILENDKESILRLCRARKCDIPCEIFATRLILRRVYVCACMYTYMYINHCTIASLCIMYFLRYIFIVTYYSTPRFRWMFADRD